MGKSTHFFGQPVYGQLIKSLDRDKIVEMSRKMGGEKYVKSFDGYVHLLTMLFAVIMRFDSLREIEAAMTAEARRKGVSKSMLLYTPMKVYHATYSLPLLLQTTLLCWLQAITSTIRLSPWTGPTSTTKSLKNSRPETWYMSPK